ncbi:hypothetical protein CC86DRAFT_125713 [Ophiobolus disseminans]|uniref:Secreted protein n=1 Tax=Ophiobolus disseminans TaxID=1469910 RepID=A0A6A6ZHF0_9PLEO|nr:hypothetical protein CC86DRAFT_125713 [Ophiobolus disseminans]
MLEGRGRGMFVCVTSLLQLSLGPHSIAIFSIKSTTECTDTANSSLSTGNLAAGDNAMCFDAKDTLVQPTSSIVISNFTWTSRQSRNSPPIQMHPGTRFQGFSVPRAACFRSDAF